MCNVRLERDDIHQCLRALFLCHMFLTTCLFYEIYFLKKSVIGDTATPLNKSSNVELYLTLMLFLDVTYRQFEKEFPN